MTDVSPQSGSHGRPAPAYPALREDENIQGNVLAGFNKDHQAFLFLQLSGVKQARAHLAEVVSKVATNRAVAAFNERFSAARRLCGGSDPAAMTSVWLGVAITARGLEVLAPAALAQLSVADVDTGISAFLGGAASRAAVLEDIDASAPADWLFGRPGQRIDVVLTVAADRADSLTMEVQRQRELAARHDTTVVFEQHGSTLPDSRRGHEHFGFRDAISQPGVSGFDPPSTGRIGEVEGKPGTVLVPPGEFVVGYERGDSPARAAPRWMWDGSFVVIRRLAQDVPGWWGHVEHISGVVGTPTERLAARAIGRWRSGTPTDHESMQDNGSARNRWADNDFDYADDADAMRTALFAHIRSMYPRHEATARRADVERHRIMRRGIPFGPHFDPAAGRGHGADADRGLVFVSYQASITDQFEVLQRIWVDGDTHKPGSGPTELRRELSLSLHPYTRTQGAVYAFTPSLAALRALVTGEPLAD